VVACALVGVLTAANRGQSSPPLFAAGALGNDRVLARVAPGEAHGAVWLEGSTVLRLGDGRLRWLPLGATEPVTVAAGDPDALARATGERAWLASGALPGATAAEVEASARSLLNLRLLTRPGGAAVAAAEPYWGYVWPRDAAAVAAAFSVTGHPDEAASILGFLGRTQLPDGTWPARSHPDGTPVTDGRPPQLDATGWVPWAAWLVAGGGTDEVSAKATWPMVSAAAHAAARSIGPSGLPRGGPDYWERPETQPTLGTAAPLRAGLRAAAGLARLLGQSDDERVFRSAASRLDAGMRARLLGPKGWRRSPGRTRAQASGPDAAVAWLAPPFAPAEASVRASVAATRAELAVAGGGVVPGAHWARSDAWTPATASFALAAAGLGDGRARAELVNWLLAHRTGLGAFPERVRRSDGSPRSVAPLAWTSALYLLTMREAEQPLPVP
jgi:GH15 family glucan-1,4-alpha-glucosidase